MCNIISIRYSNFFYQIIHFGSHKTFVGILRRTDNRLPSDIETRVNKKSTAGFFFKGDRHEIVQAEP
jgi:hypothetical protein